MARNIVLDEEWGRMEEDIYERVKVEEAWDGFAAPFDAIYRNPAKSFKKSLVRIVLQELVQKEKVFSFPLNRNLWMTISIKDKLFQLLKKKKICVHGVHIKDLYNECFTELVSYPVIYQTAIELCEEGRAYTTISEEWFLTNDD